VPTALNFTVTSRWPQTARFWTLVSLPSIGRVSTGSIDGANAKKGIVAALGEHLELGDGSNLAT
jgi:hypothetical protein